MMSFSALLSQRELDKGTAIKSFYSAPKFVEDLELTHQLFGHTGCVNALCWSSDGQFLASGSDDTQVNIYSTDSPSYPLRYRFQTGHTSNIFSVKFMPHTSNGVVVSAAGDQEVRVFDIGNGSPKRRDVFRCFKDRVKRIVPDGESPHLFLTCSEDGDIRHIDLRSPNRYHKADTAPPPLISYGKYRISLNALTLAPSQPQYIVVGGTHHALFLHDRRFLAQDIMETWGMVSDPTESTQCVRKFAPRGKRAHHVTSAKFSTANPNELLGSWSADGIYLFNIHQDGPMLDDLGSEANTQPRADPINSTVDDAATNATNPGVESALISEHPDLIPLIRQVKMLIVTMHNGSMRAESSIVSNQILDMYRRHQLPKTNAQFSIYKFVVALAMYYRRMDAFDHHRGEERERRRLESLRAVGSADLNTEVDASDSEDEEVNPVIQPRWSPRYDVIACMLQHGFAISSRTRTVRVPDPDIFRLQSYENHHPVLSALDQETLSDSEFHLAEDLQIEIETEEYKDPESELFDLKVWRDGALALIRREATKITDSVLEEAFGPTWQDNILPIDIKAPQYDIDAPVEGPMHEFSYHDEFEHDSSAWDLDISDLNQVDEDETFSGLRPHFPEQDYDTYDDPDGDDMPWLQYGRGQSDPSKLAPDVPIGRPLRAFCGHCNVQTVKDVNFFGANDEYIMSGSDCGHLFIWDKESQKLVQILEADTEIVNVVQPHPQIPQIAVSGIDRTIKIFSPYSMDYTLKPAMQGRRNTANGPSVRFWDRSDIFDTYQEHFPNPTDVTRAVIHNNDVRAKTMLSELKAPRKFLGPSRSRISEEYSIVSANAQTSQQGLADAGFTRHTLAELAEMRLHLQGAGVIDGDDRECIIA
ncbi:WD40-repeat-containing domain protein [Lipomyces arxii]|uniref:WD40-repeat-containing domain protein n=1 Tax=Lipomyces arxii TaxID=56418 RepID=UPI0034CF5F11